MNNSVVSNNIWNELKTRKPFFALAPMEDVTDTVFRQVLLDSGKPDIYFTEFTSVEGLCSPGGREVMTRFRYDSSEKPLIAQIWGINPENYLKSAEMIADMGFDGIDINMGCPIRKIIKNGGCSGMIKNPSLAKEVYLATVQGAGKLPVSIKTRIGFDRIQTEEWIGFILGLKPSALTIHGRTVKEKSLVDCHWDEIGKGVVLRNDISPDTIIIGNGDVMSLKQGFEYHDKYGVDGIMVGRGIFDNPWLFNPVESDIEHTFEQKLTLLRKHVSLHLETWGGRRNFNALKKFFKMYIKGFDGAGEMRAKMMEHSNPQETLDFIDSLIIS